MQKLLDAGGPIRSIRSPNPMTALRSPPIRFCPVVRVLSTLESVDSFEMQRPLDAERPLVLREFVVVQQGAYFFFKMIRASTTFVPLPSSYTRTGLASDSATSSFSSVIICE